MAQKPETLFKNKVRKALKSLPACWFTKIQQVTINGTPDILACINGIFVALELKASYSDRETELQKYNLKKIGESGGYGIVAHPDNWDTIYKFLSVLATEGREEANKILH